MNAQINVQLVARTKDLVVEERRALTSILHHLREIERRQVFAKLGYSSVFEFTTKHLGYSEGAAYRRISAMRLIQEMPEVEEKLQDGTLESRRF